MMAASAYIYAGTGTFAVISGGHATSIVELNDIAEMLAAQELRKIEERERIERMQFCIRDYAYPICSIPDDPPPPPPPPPPLPPLPPRRLRPQVQGSHRHLRFLMAPNCKGGCR